MKTFSLRGPKGVWETEGGAKEGGSGSLQGGGVRVIYYCFPLPVFDFGKVG